MLGVCCRGPGGGAASTYVVTFAAYVGVGRSVPSE